jgi:hypothetical protein
MSQMDNTQVTAVVQIRESMTDDSLTQYAREHFSGSLLSLRQLEPLIREVKRRFRHLPRKLGVDGKRKTISDCTKFSDWCQQVLQRSDRTVRYMLAGGNTKRSKKNGNGFRLTKYQIAALQRIAEKRVGGMTGLLHTIVNEYLSTQEKI